MLQPPQEKRNGDTAVGRAKLKSLVATETTTTAQREIKPIGQTEKYGRFV